MTTNEIARGIGTALCVGVLGPLLWLGAEAGSNYCERLIRNAVRRWGSKKPGAQERLLKRLAQFRVIRK